MQDFTAFDAWVADRYASRTSATTEVLKEAGLQKPIPGMAEMQGKGHFFQCPPYGTCWQPDAPQAKALLAAPPVPPPTPKTARPSAGGPTNGSSPGMSQQVAVGMFPCLNSWYPGMGMYGGYSMGLVPVGYTMNPSAFYYGVDPYAWAVCHSGTWIPWDNGNYAWVAGNKRHHKCPVKWVKFDHQTIAVPLHPRDIKGKPPINRAGFQPVKGKDGTHLTPIKFEPGKPVEVIKSPPREFRNAPQPVLSRATPPRMQTFALHENVKAGVQAHTAIPMNFNHQQGFVTSRQVMQGGHPVAVSVPVGRVGGSSGAMPAGGGFSSRGGSAGFGAMGATHGGGGFSGGGHVGGGSFAGGGGGGVHSGGSVSTSVSAPSASSTAAPSGGSHK